MAVRVVDLLEVVEVDRERRRRVDRATLGLAQLRAQARLERAAIEAAGERIGADLLGEPRAHRVEAAREQREVVGPLVHAEVERRREIAVLDELAEEAQRVHALAEAAVRVR